MTVPADKPWTVIRHSGRTKLPPRIAYRGREKGARLYYKRTVDDMKQGSVTLLDHAGGLQGFEWSPKDSS